MSRDVVRLHVHKNTRDQRRRKQTAADLVSDAKRLARAGPVDGYVIVTYAHYEDGTNWDGAFKTMNGLETRSLPAAVAGRLQKAIDDASS